MQNEGLDIQGILNIFAGLHLQDNHLSPPPTPTPWIVMLFSFRNTIRKTDNS